MDLTIKKMECEDKGSLAKGKVREKYSNEFDNSLKFGEENIEDLEDIYPPIPSLIVIELPNENLKAVQKEHNVVLPEVIDPRITDMKNNEKENATSTPNDDSELLKCKEKIVYTFTKVLQVDGVPELIWKILTIIEEENSTGALLANQPEKALQADNHKIERGQEHAEDQIIPTLNAAKSRDLGPNEESPPFAEPSSVSLMMRRITESIQRQSVLQFALLGFVAGTMFGPTILNQMIENALPYAYERQLTKYKNEVKQTLLEPENSKISHAKSTNEELVLTEEQEKLMYDGILAHYCNTGYRKHLRLGTKELYEEKICYFNPTKVEVWWRCKALKEDAEKFHVKGYETPEVMISQIMKDTNAGDFDTAIATLKSASQKLATNGNNQQDHLCKCKGKNKSKSMIESLGLKKVEYKCLQETTNMEIFDLE